MLDFSEARFRYEPYPIGWAPHVLPPDLYRELADSYPAFDQLRKRASLGNKYILTEFDGAAYFKLLDQHPAWRKLYDYVKNPAFVQFMIDDLKARGIDLGLGGIEVVSDSAYDSTLTRQTRRLKRLVGRLAGGLRNRFHMTSRFEFGSFPGHGGSQYPHTDTPRKVISLVLSMVKEGEWLPEWGGGTAVVWPKEQRRSFNFLNTYLGFDDVDVIEQFPFVPNSCVIFVKTFNSWHAVMPIEASADAVRKSVVINIDLIGIPEWGSYD